MALASQLAEYQLEPLHLNQNAIRSPGAESDAKNVFSPTNISKVEQDEDYVSSRQLERKLDTLPQGLPGRRHPVTAVAQMTGFALAGAILAVGHHVYFVSLHLTPSDGSVQVGGHPISRQKITNFVATVFIFLVKLCLSLSIAKAFDQQLWYTVRRRAMRLSGLDALFNVLADPTAFLNFEMVWRAKMAAGLALVAWTATFAVLPIPGSLTVQSIETQSIQDISVPTVNLAMTPAGGPIYTSSPILNTWNVQAPTKGNDTDTLSVQYVTVLQTTSAQTNCTSFNSTYSLTIQYHASQQDIGVSVAIGPSFGTAGTLIIDDPTYKPALAAIKDAVSTALVGSVFQNKQTGLDVSGIALYSALVNDTNSGNPVFRTDTPQLIEQLLTNTTISMISRNLWTTTVSAEVVSDVNVFVYQPHALWAGYGAAVGVTLLCMAVGLHALRSNGGGGGKAFSLIMATTRNPALDAVTDRALHEKGYRETYSDLRFRYTNLGGPDMDRLAFRESS
ncbi:Pc21g08530 protein [Mycena venus]|uniref:Pc21g08530 protein n=1 Tax=Mycena venus TaxID=2733690 RepID=A0A8H6XGT3_9AGAR|nr:Pc21g08530 protein [Mycena venus]